MDQFRLVERTVDANCAAPVAHSFSAKATLSCRSESCRVNRGRAMLFVDHLQNNVRLTSIFWCRYGAISRGFGPLFACFFAVNGETRGEGYDGLLSTLLQSYVCDQKSGILIAVLVGFGDGNCKGVALKRCVVDCSGSVRGHGLQKPGIAFHDHHVRSYWLTYWGGSVSWCFSV